MNITPNRDKQERTRGACACRQHPLRIRLSDHATAHGRVRDSDPVCSHHLVSWGERGSPGLPGRRGNGGAKSAVRLGRQCNLFSKDSLKVCDVSIIMILKRRRREKEANKRRYTQLCSDEAMLVSVVRADKPGLKVHLRRLLHPAWFSITARGGARESESTREHKGVRCASVLRARLLEGVVRRRFLSSVGVVCHKTVVRVLSSQAKTMRRNGKKREMCDAWLGATSSWPRRGWSAHRICIPGTRPPAGAATARGRPRYTADSQPSLCNRTSSAPAHARTLGL